MAKGYDIDDAPTSNGRDRAPRVSELVDLVEFTTKWQTFRLVGQVFPYGGHWVKTVKRDGSKGTFFTPCLSFDPETGRRDSTKKCPWCAHDDKEKIQYSTDFYINAISRKKQRQIPDELEDPNKKEIKTGFKDKESDTFTIYQALRMPNSIANAVKSLKDLNVHEVEGETQAFGVSHARYGCDISIKMDPNAAAAQRYAVQKLEASPLKKSEKSFLMWDLSELVKVPTYAEAKSEFDSWAKRNKVSTDGEGGGDDDDEAPKKKKKAVDDDDDDFTPSRKKAPIDEDDDDEPPVKKRRAKVVDEDDDDEPPVKKRRAPPPDDDDDDEEAPPKRKKKPVVEDEDEDDDTPPPKKKRPVVEEDDDEPPVKRRKPPVDEDEEEAPPPKKKRRVVEEDDEEESPPPKKKKKVVEDDDDDDIPF